MTIDNLDALTRAVTFAVAFIGLYIGHQVGDHFVQTGQQCEDKGKHGDERWTGRRACAAHVASYTLCQAIALGFIDGLFHLDTRPAALTLGLAVSAVTHYIADRREPLRRMAYAFGKGDFYELGRPRPGRDDNPVVGTGAYALDQTWHKLWIGVAALVIALVPW
jgi:hypothetical protein